MQVQHSNSAGFLMEIAPGATKAPVLFASVGVCEDFAEYLLPVGQPLGELIKEEQSPRQ